MELRIFFDVFHPIIRLEKIAGAFGAFAQLGQQLGGHDRCAHGIDFKRLAKVVEVFHLLRCKAAQIGATPRFNSNQALGV